MASIQIIYIYSSCQKCDGLAPCTPCTNSQRDCIFVPKKKLPGPPTAAALSTKLALLQERFNELATAFQQELVAPENADGHMPGSRSCCNI